MNDVIVIVIVIVVGTELLKNTISNCTTILHFSYHEYECDTERERGGFGKREREGGEGGSAFTS